MWHAGGFDFGTFLLVVSIAATWQITYAPYVADYSRYLPSSTGSRPSFWWTYLGAVGASVWMMIFGSVAAATAPKVFGDSSVAYVVGLAPGSLSGLFFLIVILGALAVNVLNLYGTFMSTTTTLSAVLRLRVGSGLRAGFILGAAVVGTALALAGSANFLHHFESFILLLSYFLVPWTAINLVDFYLIRRERYDVPAMFDPNGRYGRVNWRTLIAYLVGVGVEVPFVSTEFYTGPMVEPLGGADISWAARPGGVRRAVLGAAAPPRRTGARAGRLRRRRRARTGGLTACRFAGHLAPDLLRCPLPEGAAPPPVREQRHEVQAATALGVVACGDGRGQRGRVVPDREP